MTTNTNFPNGLETSDVLINGKKFVNLYEVDVTNDVALTSNENTTHFVKITASGTAKTLTLNEEINQLMFVQNDTSNNVTLKNLTADTGVTITANKTAQVLITSGEILKIFETA